MTCVSSSMVGRLYALDADVRALVNKDGNDIACKLLDLDKYNDCTP
jgi:hypothetical protein